VQETNGMHQFVYYGAFLRHAARNLKIHILPTADPTHAAPATGIAGGNSDVIAFLARIGLKSDARVLVIVVHRVAYEFLLLRIYHANLKS